MKHVYLTKESVCDALQHHAITLKEAEKLEECIECQKKIYKVTHH